MAMRQPGKLNGLRTVDPSGRINLGKGRSDEVYSVAERADGTIVLTPMAAIPKRELWLFKNKEALASVLKGIEQSKRGEGEYLGSFAQYLDEDDED